MSVDLSVVMLRIAPDGFRTCARLMAPRLVVNGTNARRLRRDAKLTQEVAAVRLGLAVSTLRRVERGRENVTLSTLGKIADLYSVDPCDLLRRARGSPDTVR